MMLRKTLRRLSRINGLICAWCGWIVALLTAAISLILFVAVTTRYCLNMPLTWAEDATCFMLVWLVLLGAPVAMRARAHVAIDSLVCKLPPVLHKGVTVLGLLVVLFVAGFFLLNGATFTSMGMKRIIPSMEWMPFGYAYLAFPVGYGLLGLVCVELLLREFLNPDDTPDNKAV